ncbi:MAG TPA: Ig-like domain-containing protein [Bacteroidales bacterium]|nr:Ig-like domain-containing protein [Bacteroidales bacterium]
MKNILRTNAQNARGKQPVKLSWLRFNTLIICLLLVGMPALKLSAQVTADATTYGSAVAGTTITVAHTTTTAADRLLLVGISTRDKAVTSVTYDGTPLTLAGQQTSLGEAKTFIYYMVAPSSGAHNVVVTCNGALGKGAVAGVMTFTGVNQTTPLGAYASSSGESVTASLNVSSASSELVFNVVSVHNQNISCLSSQTQQWNVNTPKENTGGGCTKKGSATTTLAWLLNKDHWSMSGISIKPTQVCDLAVQKTAGNLSPVIGDSITFSINVNNNGPSNATSVLVNDMLPNGFTYLSHSTTTGTYNSTTGVWNIGSLNNQINAALTITALVSCSQNYANTAVISGAEPDDNAGNNTSIVTVTPQNTIAKTYYICSGSTFDLTALNPCNKPSGANVTWHTGTPASVLNKIPDPSTVYAGIYYVAFEDPVNSCYSPTNSFTILYNPVISASLAASPNPILCLGDSSTLTVTASGGTGTLQFSLNNGPFQTNNTFSAGPGTYSVTVKDDLCTKKTNTVVVTEPAAALGISFVSKTDVSCGGQNTGSITVAGNGGTMPYTYSIDGINFQASGTFSGLAPGTYTLYVNDAGNCGPVMLATPVTINQSGVGIITLTPTVVQPTCLSLGSITLDVTGGTPPYTYDWSDITGSNDPKDRTDLYAGSYSVTVSDSIGCAITSGTIVLNAPVGCSGTGVCQSDTASLFSTEPKPENLYYTWTIESILYPGTFYNNAIVSGDSTHSITVNWNNVPIGPYDVCVVAHNVCGATSPKCETVIVTTLTPNAYSSNVCSGTSFQLFASGGDTYSWTGPHGCTSSCQNPVIYNADAALHNGNYIVTVSVTGGCSATDTVPVFVNPTPTMTSSVTSSICLSANGAIDITPGTGTPPFTYQWSNGAGTEDIANLPAGSYTVTITDDNGCTAKTTASVSDAGGPLVIAQTITNVNCFGGIDGAVEINTSSGTPPYTYLWSNGATSQNIYGVGEGTYHVAVSDINGCKGATSADVTQPLDIILDQTHIDILCTGGTGSINLIVSGGTTPYSYSWSNGASTEDISGLNAGLYRVTVTDAHNCTDTLSVNVTSVSSLTASTVVTPVSCNGGSDGQIILTVNGGTTPYSYSWSGPNSFTAYTKDVNNLVSGTYSVTVTDDEGCTFILSTVTVSQPDSLVVNANITSKISCFGNSNGSIGLTVTGGTAGYTYDWSNGASTMNISGITAGTYNVLVTDAKGCTATASVQMTQPGELVATASPTNAGCYGDSTGIVDLTVTGGTPIYAYNWSNSAVTEDLLNVPAGLYSVTVTDSSGCTAYATTTVNQPEAIYISAFVTNILCSGTHTGAIDLNVAGGTGPYTYSWADGSTDENRTGLTAATYYVTVSDSINCHATKSFDITQLSAISLSTVNSNVLCNGGSDGGINLIVTGGTLPYTYLWDNAEITEDIFGLTAGTYSVIVTDANLCTDTLSTGITEPLPFSATADIQNVGCFGGNDGNIDLTISGGTPLYSFIWSNGAVTEDLNNVPAGSYTVSVTDVHLCTAKYDYSITQPGFQMELYADVTPSSACSNATGKIDLTVVNGVPPFNYLWTGPTPIGNIQDPVGLDTGTYIVIVTDFTGCSDTLSGIFIDKSPDLTVDVLTYDRSCSFANGEAYAVVTGGTGPYTYLWSNSATTANISGLDVGIYIVTVTDINGCTATDSGPVGIPPSCLPPVAVDDFYTTFYNTPVTGSVAPNDSDPDNTLAELEFELLDNPLPGQGIIVFDTSGNFTYTPPIGFSDTISLAYEVCDPSNLCDQGLLTIIVLPENHPPVAINDINATLINTPVSGNMLTNDNEPDGDNLIINVTPLTPPSNGNVVIYPDGSYVYVPVTGFLGTDTYIYEVCDDGIPVLCDTAVVTITVTEPGDYNQPPIAINDAYQGSINTMVSGTVITNDSDPDGNLNYNSVILIGPAPGNGILVLNANGTFEFIPANGFVGQVAYNYQICDLGAPALCDTATVTIDIMPNDDGNSTFAHDDSYMTNKNTPVSGNVLDNDYDPQGDAQTVDTVPLSGPMHGTLTLNSDGTFDYIPFTDYTGPDNFIYELCDDGIPMECDSATAYILVLPYNNPPVAINDINTTLLNTPVSGNMLTNDNEPDGDNLVINTTPLSNPANGNVIIYSDGSYTYIPNTGFTGTDSYVYEVCDDIIPPLCDTAIVTITVTEQIIGNQPPIAINDAYQGSINTMVTGTVIINDSDPDGNLDPNSVILIGPAPGNGTLVLNSNGTFNFVPANGFTGQVTYDYQICDLGNPSLCDTATVTIDIMTNQDGNSTFAHDDSYITNENTAVSGNVSDNDYDPQGDNQTVNALPIADPMHGSVLLIDDGTFTYVPDLNYTGPDNFIYEVCDDGNPMECDQATVYILVLPHNNPPVAINDINSTLINTPVAGNMLTNDNEPDGDNLVINTTPLANPSNGIVTIYPDGSYVYIPNNGFTGIDVYTYEVCDDIIPALCDTAIVTITVKKPGNFNQPPVAINDAYQGSINTLVTGTVITNDSDPDGNLNPNSVILVGPSPGDGVLVLNTDGTFEFVPDNNFTGQVSFYYQICDLALPPLCDTALVTIDIQTNFDGNSTFAHDDAYFTNINTPVSANVSDNDYDPQGDNQTVNITPLKNPMHGTLTLNDDGTFLYTPDPNYTGPDNFVYEVCDDGTPQECDSATVYILIFPYNNPPVAINDINNTLINTPVTGNMLTNDNEPDGDNLVINTTPLTQPVNGTVTIYPNGSYTYVPNNGFTGTDTYVYEVCDDVIPPLCDTALVTITVTRPDTANNPPIAINDAYQGSINTPVVGTVISNDSDPDGNLNANSVVLIGPAPGNGNLILNSDGSFQFTPVIGFTGQVTFDYQICDLGIPSLCDTAMVTIDIMTNDDGNSTFAHDDSYFTNQDVPVTGNVLDNDYDPQGDNQNVNTAPLTDPLHGSVILNADGTFTYTPDLNYTGPDHFVYEVCDDGTPQECDSATVYILVSPNINSGCLMVKVFLQGSYKTTNHLMADSLRVHGFIPVKEPYSSAPYNTTFMHHGGGGGEQITDSATVLGVTGPNAIVDWVFIELRDKNNNINVKYTRSALLQRDGNVVDIDGISPVCFTGLDDVNYYVVVRHRNHFGVMTANVKTLTPAGTLVNFTDGSEPEFNFGTSHPVAGPSFNYTGLSQKTMTDGAKALWAGDVNRDRKIKYRAPGDDLFTIFYNVLTYPTNVPINYNFDFALGYFAGDADLSGKVKFQAPGDDYYLIFQNVLTYPLNPTHNYNFNVLFEQLPY